MALPPAGSEEAGLTSCAIVGSSSISLGKFFCVRGFCLTRPGKLCRRKLEISTCDPPRKTLPQEVGNFDLRDSIGTRLAGTIAVNVTQVMVSSNWLETGA